MKAKFHQSQEDNIKSLAKNAEDITKLLKNEVLNLDKKLND